MWLTQDWLHFTSGLYLCLHGMVLSYITIFNHLYVISQFFIFKHRSLRFSLNTNYLGLKSLKRKM
jgi:hypothetical protein